MSSVKLEYGTEPFGDGLDRGTLGNAIGRPAGGVRRGRRRWPDGDERRAVARACQAGDELRNLWAANQDRVGIGRCLERVGVVNQDGTVAGHLVHSDASVAQGRWKLVAPGVAAGEEHWRTCTAL